MDLIVPSCFWARRDLPRAVSPEPYSPFFTPASGALCEFLKFQALLSALWSSKCGPESPPPGNFHKCRSPCGRGERREGGAALQEMLMLARA